MLAGRTVAAIALTAMLLALATSVQAQDSFGGGATPRRPPASPATPPPSFQRDDSSQAAQMERAEMGVAPTRQLHTGPMHGPTPASLPGGDIITTVGLQTLVTGAKAAADAGRPSPFLLLDVLGGQLVIPGAQYAVPAAQAGSFNDAVQQQFGQYLQQATGGNKNHLVVLYCQSRECWMSYNASLRAIALGYRNVLWYRGGIEAWQAAGHQLQPVRSR